MNFCASLTPESLKWVVSLLSICQYRRVVGMDEKRSLFLGETTIWPRYPHCG